ncbi:nicotinate-nucleotide adenylyltransferase [Candidiatus Paracoxiella cheracis]|uniref:nicotinate-nucleotide adenylyltransferase n=1 Tax=Candidiatus Paracoxiella cheracis TaxID=3405120 RepID=UPI003BF57338
MAKNKILIGLLGGTFDPIHFGHLEIAERILKQLHFAEIQFIPSGHPPHREPIASAKDRLAMIKLAIAPYKNFVLNAIETTTQQTSYTIDTLKKLKQQMQNKTLCFILATDAFSKFNQWKDWQSILDYCHLIIAPRPDFPLPDESWMRDLLAQHEVKSVNELYEKESGYILIQDISKSRISATKIRKAFATGHFPEDMLPKSVIDYIRQHHLYHEQ